MTILDVEFNSDERRTRNRNAVEKIRQLTELLADVHSQGKEYDQPIPSSFIPHLTGGEVCDITPDVSELQSECSNEWRRAEEKDLKSGDIFSLGCYFYYVITGGQHPFGKKGHRTLLIANNLYDLTACRDGPLKQLIARMICRDSTKRPSSSDLLNHPYLWKEDRAESYLVSLGDNLDENSERYQIWKDTFLFSFELRATNFHMVRENFITKSILSILMDIKEKKETALNACQLFPDLLSTVYFNENPDAILEEIKSSCPETLGNVLIANDCFAGVLPDIGIERRHGRFGAYPVHVMQFPVIRHTDDSISLMTRLSCLNHPNLLQYFYLRENSDKNLVLACEPFDEVLKTWMEKNSQLTLNEAKEILIQITLGLVYYHSNELIHGNLTSSQIAITNSNNAVTAKICKFLTDEKDCTENSSSTMQNDIRKLGQIFADLLRRTKDVPPSSLHLIQSMKDIRDECVPPSVAIFYHPFFWSPKETDYFRRKRHIGGQPNPNIDGNSCTASVRHHYENEPNSKRPASDSATKVQTSSEIDRWLKGQETQKSAFPNFYYPFYNFPTREKLSAGTQENINRQIALLSKEQYAENQGPHGIQNYLENYFKKWAQATEDSEAPEQVTKHPAPGIPLLILQHPASDSSGRTAMHLACHSDHFYDSAKKLLELDCNPNIADKNGFVPLHVAALNSSFKIAELLIENKATIDLCNNKELTTPLFCAALSNSVLISELLMKMGADTNKVDAFGQTVLHIAVVKNSVNVAKLLLENGCQKNVNAVDDFGKSPLHIAVFHNLIQMAHLLLDNGANPNVTEPGKNAISIPVLHLSVKNKSPQMMELLLRKGANPNLVTYQGDTPLHVAAVLTPTCQICLQMVKLLIDLKADVNAVDGGGRTPLHLAILNAVGKMEGRVAADHGAREVVKLLIAKGADIEADDDFGSIPIDYARCSNKEDFIKFIEKSSNEEDFSGMMPLGA
ncbi:uncharacterized protein LOC130691644 isoform X2 [Daphnia carinata]|uniref:uncharacterized protein LOC130691644 isoform X2 n=1 Tax=Daphnia carinata TaxID=120202 RepID=UPI00257BCA85|nr:uncharacterized protein LOC130691644 isoform X2 [Daphnia carinata]